MAAIVNDWKDGVSITGATNQTLGPYTLVGGRYAFAAGAPAMAGGVQLQVLLPDQATYVPAAPALVANGAQSIDLAPGTYQIVCNVANASIFLVRVPYRAA